MGRFAEYSEVVITSERFVADGVSPGAHAVVLDDYQDGNYELQVFDAHGNTIGQFSAREDELRQA